MVGARRKVVEVRREVSEVAIHPCGNVFRASEGGSRGRTGKGLFGTNDGSSRISGNFLVIGTYE